MRLGIKNMTVNYIIEFNLKLDHFKALAGSRGQVLEIQLYIPGYKQAMSGGKSRTFEMFSLLTERLEIIMLFYEFM